MSYGFRLSSHFLSMINLSLSPYIIALATESTGGCDGEPGRLRPSKGARSSTQAHNRMRAQRANFFGLSEPEPRTLRESSAKPEPETPTVT